MSLDVPPVSNEDKEAVWRAYRERKPIRVPVMIATNPRVVVLNPALNRRRVSFERIFTDPEEMFEISLAHEYYRRTVINRFCDSPTGLPDEWTASANWQNTYEAVILGGEYAFHDGQVPDTRPFLLGGDREKVFEINLDRILERPFFRTAFAFYEAMLRRAEGYRFHGRPVKVARYTCTGCDGPLTVAMNIRGPDILTDLVLDPDYAARLLDFITDAAIRRVHAFRAHYRDETISAGFADDSIQLVSTQTYRDIVLPRHRRYYEEFWPGKPRSIHLCGDVMRHMKVLRDELNVRSWDSGFPVDFKRMREELGPDMEIYGGPPVALLLNGRPQEVYDECSRILESGVMAGGRFVLREANNLPPCVPEENLAAMYKAALDKGRY